ncbi:hypothetical protein [Myxococcus sp. AB036A]|uniref:hypothetical protein n=1 Tax=Myxococcus sp. AB036A TaxID=2562793 RepID=UPI001890D09E|nr:hypothetical protein [Myxococcus sp. AB036A]
MRTLCSSVNLLFLTTDLPPGREDSHASTCPKVGEQTIEERAHSFAPDSDRLTIPEELVIFIVTAVPTSHFEEVSDELDASNPLHLLEAELNLVAQAARPG